MTTNARIAAALCTLLALGGPDAAWAQGPEFYQGKQVRIIVGNATGGDYDLGARSLARHMGRHLPGNPAVIVQNMPGASGNTAAQFIYAVAPKDGTVFGSFSRNLPSQAALGKLKIDVDPRKYNWIGASSLPGRVCVAAKGAPVQTAKDTLTKELIVGSTGTASVQSIVPGVLNKVLNTKFKIIEGYKGISDIVVALERGEVQGVCHLTSVFEGIHAELLKQGKVVALFNVEEASVPSMPGMPSIFAFTNNEQAKQLLRFVFSSAEFGRPYVAPPDTPKERVEDLRKAFKAALQDKALIEEAVKLKLDMSYRAPDALMALIDQLYATPAALKAKVEELLPNTGE